MFSINKRGRLAIILALATLYIFSVLFMETSADPVGAQVTNVSTLAGYTAPDSRTDEGGTITITTISTTQQNYAWKAYVGNMTASLTLNDANGRTIFDWTISQSSLSGQLFVTRVSGVSWASLACANRTNIAAEESYLNMGATDGDNINHTFSYVKHPTYSIAGQIITNSTCQSLFTYVNSTAQSDNESSPFSEFVMQNGAGDVIYVTELENDYSAYSGQDNSTYDFQIIVPDNDFAGNITTYYFYAEIDS